MAVQRTGLSGYCDEIRFFVAEKYLESDVVQVSVDDEVWENLWEKVLRMFEWKTI